jgi:hypothetical protein
MPWVNKELSAKIEAFLPTAWNRPALAQRQRQQVEEHQYLVLRGFMGNRLKCLHIPAASLDGFRHRLPQVDRCLESFDDSSPTLLARAMV